MGLLKLWKEAKAVAASGAPPAPSGHAQHGGGMMMGFMGAMMKTMGPILAAQAPERGDPLPGTEPGVLEPQDPGAMQAAAGAVRARDSAFDPGVLTTFAGQVFAAVSSTWGTGDVASVRGLLADRLWEPLSATLASGMGTGPGMIYAHQKGTATLAGLWAGEWYDTARFSVAVDVDLPVDAQHPIPPGLSKDWTEDWLLQRSVAPGGDPMKLAEACPSCGAPTATDDTGRCTHCHEVVPILTTGWLVTCIRSHNPALEMMRAQIVGAVTQNPQELQMMPDELVRLLPADVVARIDPQRAAALGLHG
jgi:hypothetical protein